MRKKAGFIVLSIVLAGSLMGCSFSLKKDADGSSKKAETTVTEETGKTDETTGMDIGSDTETSEEASSAAGSDGKAAALPEEKEVGFGTGEMPEAYSDNMVADSKMSGKVQTKDGEVVYHLPYIDYDSTACENVNTQIEKLGNDYMAKAGAEYTDCIAIGYEWSVYQDLLSVVVRVDFDANERSIFVKMYFFQRMMCWLIWILMKIHMKKTFRMQWIVVLPIHIRIWKERILF